MAHILHAYLVTVREARGEPMLLGNFDDAGANLLSLVHQFLGEHEAQDWSDEDTETALRVREVFPPTEAEPEVLAAWVRSGQGGRTSEFVDLTEEGLSEEVRFRRKPHHAEVVSVLVVAQLPRASRDGFLVVHSPHGAGIKTKFWLSFRTWFRARYPNYVLGIEPTVPGGAYAKLVEQGDLRKVTLVRRVRQSDLTDEERRYFEEDAVGTIRTVISAPRLGRLRKRPISDVLSGDAAMSSILTFEGEDYNEVSVEVFALGRRHTIHLGENRVPRGGEDVTDVLDYEEDTPTFESLRGAALNYIKLLRDSR